MVFEYIQERFRTAYKYFACPQRRHGGGLCRAQMLAKQGTKVEEEDDDESLRLTRLTEDEESESDGDGASDPSTQEGEKTLGTSLMSMVLSGEDPPSSSPNGLLDSEEEEKGSTADQDGPADHLHYVFDKMIFTGGKVNEAHLRDPLLPVSSLPVRFRSLNLTDRTSPMPLASNSGVQHLQARRSPEGRVSRRLQEDRAEASASHDRPLQGDPGRALQAVLL